MLKVRVILVCTLLLLAAVPTFALPLCAECNEWNTCDYIPGAIERCYSSGGACWTTPDRCSPPRSAPVLADWRVESIEINRDSITASATPQAEPKAEVRTLEVAEQK